MKYIAFFVALIINTGSFSLLAQKEATQAVKRNLVERVQYTAQALQLDERQTAKLEKIYLRENAQLEQIRPLKSSDEQKYAAKLQAIRKGTAGSIRLLLREDQIPLYYQLAGQWRLQEHHLRQKMKGASEVLIQEALIGTN